MVVEPVRFFFDTEFTNDDPARLELISIAFVGDDGSEYYAISSEFDEGGASDWVREHVLPLLEPRADARWRSRARIRDDVVAFLGDRATELWAITPIYDAFLLHGLFGGWGSVPPALPWSYWDVKQLAWHLGVAALPEQPAPAHHALADARYTRDAFAFLSKLAAERGLSNPG